MLELDRFVDPLSVPEHLHCTICFTALDSNMIVCKSEHVCCGQCFVKLYCPKSQGQPPKKDCFTCAEPIDLLNVVRSSKVIERALDEYKLRCSFKKCNWIGAASNVLNHEKQCTHRPPRCQHCLATFPGANKVPQVHQTTCPNVLVICARGGPDCGGPRRGLFRRCDTDKHQTVCMEFPCKVDPRCKIRTGQAHIETHRRSCSLRTTVIAELVVSRTDQIETLQLEVVALRRRLDRAKVEYDLVQNQVGSLKSKLSFQRSVCRGGGAGGGGVSVRFEPRIKEEEEKEEEKPDLGVGTSSSSKKRRIGREGAPSPFHRVE